MANPKYWVGVVPSVDDFDNPITDEFIDGICGHSQTWAIMTPKFHNIYGWGLGTGKGQRYKKQEDGRFLKVEG